MTRVKLDGTGGLPTSSVASTNAISLGNFTVANATAVQGTAGTMLASTAAAPGSSTLQNTQLFGTTIDCYDDVFKEITKKLNCNWDETGGLAISDILDTSGIVSSVTQPIVYDAADLFRQDITTSQTATLTSSNNPGALALVAAPPAGTNGIPPGAIVVQRRLQDEKGRIWTIEGLPQEQIAFATVAAPGTSGIALQQATIQPSSLTHLIEPIQTPQQPQPQPEPQVQPAQQQQQPQTHPPVLPADERWFESEDTLSWTQSKIGRYSPNQKVFRCVDCDFIGFLSRVAEHWLGNHADYRVFQCPRCPYTSAWGRCVRMHLTRQHGETLTDNSLWKDNPVLEEVTKYLTTLKTKVEQKIQESASGNGEKRYTCPYCPYQTDRRDLYNRHENIHREDKPFQCYVCDKQFNRADHVKKHFTRMHREFTYDINKIRKSSIKLNLQFLNRSKLINSKQQQQEQLQSQSQIQLQMQPSDQLIADESQFESLQMKHPENDPVLGMAMSVPVTHAALPSRQSTNTGQSQTPSVTQPRIPCTNPASVSASGQSQSGIGGIKKEGKVKGQKKKKASEKLYSCSYCPWQGVDNWCLKRHLNTHIKPFLCALCDYKAARSERLATHVLKVHNKRVCHKCNFLADDSESLSQHIQDSHQNPLVKSGFNCNICQEYFELRADLEAHAILEHQKVIVQCDLCDYRTTDELSMEAHLRDKHNLTPGSGAVAAAAAAAIGQHATTTPFVSQPPVQNQTSVQLETTTTTSEHQTLPQSQSATGSGPQANVAVAGPSSGLIPPSFTSPTLTMPQTGEGAVQESETEPDEPDTLCEKCGIDFIDEQSRKLHEKRHELVNPAEDEAVKGAKAGGTKRFLRSYVCSTCSYTCSTKKMMMQHQRAHTNFELVCRAEKCLFSTPFDNTLKEHIQNDHGSEEHVRCPHCGMRMPSSSAFTTHWRFHHNTVCSLCVNVYRVKYDVKENEIHDVICKIPSSSTGFCADTDRPLMFRLDSSDFTGLSLDQHPFDDDLARIVMSDSMDEPFAKRQRLESPSPISSTATLYKREGIKFLPHLVEVIVQPTAPNVKKMVRSSRSRSRRRKRPKQIRQGVIRRIDCDGNSADVTYLTSGATPSKKTSSANVFINKCLKVLARKEQARGNSFARVSTRRRYCQRGTFSWLFRNSKEGYKCFNPVCEENRCSWRYPRKIGLLLHNLWHHRLNRYKCDICGLNFPYFYKAFLHKIISHAEHSPQELHNDGNVNHGNLLQPHQQHQYASVITSGHQQLSHHLHS